MQMCKCANACVSAEDCPSGQVGFSVGGHAAVADSLRGERGKMANFHI